MTLKPAVYLLILYISIMMQCTSSKKELKTVSDSTQYNIKYADGFKISVFPDYKIVTVAAPYPGARKGYTYLLVQKGKEVPAHDAGTTVIMIPLTSIVCTSTTHIPLLDYLGETDKLVGFPTTDYISSEKMRKRIDAGAVKDLGIDKGMNIEQLVALHPSMVMGYTMTSDLGQLKKIRELGIPVVVNSEYLEKHPLGRAEWIKFMSYFFNKEQEADSIFNEIESEYLTTQLKDTAVVRPTAMSGIVYGDSWFLPGGRNYAARIFDDARIDYLWKSDTTSGFLELSFESVYAKAKDADIWIGVGSFKTLNEIKSSESRYTLFKPFRNGKVYTYGARKGAKGGSEFLELGYLRPDLILKDLVKIAHPELLPNHVLYFHARLQ